MYQKLITDLEQRLKQPLPGREAQLKMAPSFRPDIISNEASIKAGVLLFLYPINLELYTILIKRPEYPGVHGGQISFPGGKKELRDKNLTETALREAEEEVGIPAKKVNVLGILTPLYIPVSKIEVFPSVGFYDKRPTFRSDPHEVETIIEVPLHSLFYNAIKQIDRTNHGEIPYFNIQGYQVWGATAMILNEFLEIIGQN